MDEPLRILYVSHYFPPEVNAPAVRVSEMSEYWAKQGAKVTVLTCFPNHPSGVIPDEYKGLWRCREKHGKLNVVRTYVYAAPNKGFLKRILNYLSFMVSSVIFGLPVIGKTDIVIATSPQFFVGLAGYLISRIKSAKFIFEVRDLWPEEIVAVGALKNKTAIRFLEGIEMFLYRKADLVVTVAQGALDTLKERGVPESKLALIPNGVDIDFIQNNAHGEKIRAELNLQNKFVIGYIGTHGMAHKLDTVIQAAALLREHENVRFLLVGDGAEKKKLIDTADRFGLKNVIFHDQVDRIRVPEFYAACDICLVPLKKAGIFTRNIPSKIYEIMAARRPIIISTDGESRRMIERAAAGIGALPENASDLAEKITFLQNDPEFCDRLGQNGFAFVLANSSRPRLAAHYLDIIKQLAEIGIDVVDVNKKVRLSENGYSANDKVKVPA